MTDVYTVPPSPLTGDTGAFVDLEPAGGSTQYQWQIEGTFDGATAQLEIDDVSGSGGGNAATSGGGSEYSPGLNVPFNVASRNVVNAINGAIDGSSLTEFTSTDSLPDPSAADLIICGNFMGTIALFRQWDRDIADAGIEEATA